MLNAPPRIYSFKRALMDGEVVKQKRNPFSPQATQYIIRTQWTLSETKIEAINLRLLSLTQCRRNRRCSHSCVSWSFWDSIVNQSYLKIIRGRILDIIITCLFNFFWYKIMLNENFEDSPRFWQPYTVRWYAYKIYR